MPTLVLLGSRKYIFDQYLFDSIILGSLYQQQAVLHAKRKWIEKKINLFIYNFNC